MVYQFQQQYWTPIINVNLAQQPLSIVSLFLNNRKHGKMNNHLFLKNDLKIL